MGFILKLKLMRDFNLLFILLILFSKPCLSQTIEQLQQQLSTAKKQDDVNAEVKATISLAKQYEKQKNYEQAIVYYKVGLSIFEQNNQKENTAVCFASISNAYLKNNQYTESIAWNNKALKLFEQLNDKKNIAYTNMLNGDNYIKLKQTEKAISFFEKSTSIYKTLNDNKSEAIVLNKIGTAYASYGNYDKALLNLNSASKIASTIGTMEAEVVQINKNIEAVKNNSKNTESIKTDFVKQKEKEKEQTIVGLSTQNIKSLEEIEQLSIEAQVKELKIKAQQEQLLLKQLQVEKQKKEYEYLQKEKEFERIKHEEKIYRQQLIIIAISILSLLLLVIAIIIYKYYKAKKKALNLLKEKNREILEQGEKIKNQAVEIARYQSQMNPHFIFNAINGFQNSILEGDKENALNQIQSFSKLMRQTLNNAENEYITLNDEITYLNKYIEFELYRFSKKFKFNIIVDETINKELKIPTMLIQPLLENAIKHGNLNSRDNGEIKLKFSTSNQHPHKTLIITVIDNGIGTSRARSTGSVSTSVTNIGHESKATAITQHRLKLEMEKANIKIDNCFQITSPLFLNEKFKGAQSLIEVPFVI